nr:hypothetical protein [Tanacetum cinerariifolium]
MQIRSSSRLASNPSSNPTPTTNPYPKGRNRRCSKQRIENFNLEDLSPPIVTMADQPITADNFELKHGLFTLVQNKQFFRHDKEDPHARVRYFNKITSTLKFPNVPNTLIKLMLFPFSLEDQDSLNSVVGGNFLNKMPYECLAIIESKSKVRYSRNKPIVSKVSTNTSTSVEESCVTCGGAHSYRNCPATDGNVYRDNIQEFVSQAFAINYNQGNTSYRPPMMSNQIRPPIFPPVSIYLITGQSTQICSNPSSNPTPSTNPNLKGRNRRRLKQRIEEFNLEDLSPLIVTTADQRTMAQLLQAPTEGYEDAIVVPAITADNFELKHGLLTLFQNKQFFGHDKEDPHAHV